MTELGPEGLIVGGLRIPYYAGAMHYWRVPRGQWAACLRKMHAIGFTIVETPVPWRIHEPERGEAAWNEERDLAAFIEAARAAGLLVVLRIGPSVNAELPGFGVPDWVLEEPAVQAQTSRGTPAWMPVPPRAFPIPSLASRAYHEHVRRWYAAIAKVVAPYLDETVVALGIDHAQLRDGAYDLDYHPDALVWWDEHVPGIAAPRAWDPANAAVCAQWVGFKRILHDRAIALFAAMLDEVGVVGIATFSDPTFGHHAARAKLSELRRHAQRPIAFEVGMGFVPWYPPLDAKDDPTRERDQLLSVLSQGVRGFGLSMAVEREQHYGAAIASDGKLEAHAAWLEPLLGALADLEWPTLRRTIPIAVIDARADERFGLASTTIDPVPPILANLLGLGALELGRDPAALATKKWQLAVCRALELAQVPYELVPETSPVDQLATYRAVILPTIDRIDHQAFASLCTLAEARKTICVIGPATPTRDELERPLSSPIPKRVGKLNPGSLEDLRGLADDLVALAGELPETWQVERPEDVRTTVFADPTGKARCIFVINESERAATAVIFAEGTTLRDVVTGEVIVVSTDGRAQLAIHAHGVRLLAIS